jgi:hypothetical protein
VCRHRAGDGGDHAALEFVTPEALEEEEDVVTRRTDPRRPVEHFDALDDRRA